MSTFVLDALGSHAQGYLAKPAKDSGKFAALLLLQYAGVYALNAKSVAARAAEGWLVMDVDSHDKLPFEPTGNAPKNYAMVGDTDRETSYFLNMYLRDSRALDYLMGGQQSLMLAGLRPEKITAVLVCYRHRFPARGHLYSTESNSCSKATGQTGGLVKTEMNGREGSSTRGSSAGEGACPTKPCVFSGTGESSLGGGFANDRIGA
jgi:uncharacterized membrane protein YgcG